LTTYDVQFNVAVPLLLSEKDTPLGKAPVSLKVGVSEPPVVMVNELALPAVTVAVAALVMVGATTAVTAAESVTVKLPLGSVKVVAMGKVPTSA
jgi:hypothetical protein